VTAARFACTARNKNTHRRAVAMAVARSPSPVVTATSAARM